MDDNLKPKIASYNKRSHRSKSSYSESNDEKKSSKRNRSNSYRNESEDEKLPPRSKQQQQQLQRKLDSRSASRSRSYTSMSNESAYSRSYRSRSMSRSPDNGASSRHRKHKHQRHHSRSWTRESSGGHSYDDKSQGHQGQQQQGASRGAADNKSRSPARRHSKDRKKTKDPRDKSKREHWKNKVYIVGEIMKDTVFHFCDTCQMPIFIYCRLIPCKHIFCYPCGSKYQDKKCPRCEKKVNQTERCNFGTIYMCYQGGSPHGMQGCRRTYLSQRDLDSHINHRHNKSGPTSNQPTSNQCPIMQLPVSNPLNMLPPNFINSFPGQFQPQHLQSLFQPQQMPLNQLQSQQLASMSHSQPAHMMPPLGNMMGPNQQSMNSNQNQMPNQSFGLPMPHLGMMSCNMNQNNMPIMNQNAQNVNVGSMNNSSNSSVPQMGPNNSLVQTTLFMHGAGPNNPTNPLMMGPSNPGFNTANGPPLMTQLSNLIQGISQQSQAGRQFHDLHRQFQRPLQNQQQNWSNQSSQVQQGPINHSSNQ